MNIFALDNNPFLAAQWQHDRHVVKMTLETSQLLSTAVWHNHEIRKVWQEIHGDFRLGIDNVDSGSVRLYKSISNPNHPVAVWTRESIPNFLWTFAHLNGLIDEYHRRFQKLHGCNTVRCSFYPVAAKMAGVERFWTRDSERKMIVDPAIVALYESHGRFAVCMPDEYKLSNNQYRNAEIQSYQRLYLFSKIHQDHVKWTRCESLPKFITLTGAGMATMSSTRALIDSLVVANSAQVALRSAPNPLTTHPDLHKPTNPRALTRFGVAK